MYKDKLEKLIEVSIKIVVNGDVFCDMLCTPKNIDYLVSGWLFSQGYITCNDDIESIFFDQQILTVFVKANCLKSDSVPSLADYTAKAIFSDEDFLPQILSKNSEKFIKDKVSGYGRFINEKRVKGLHAALLCYNDFIMFDEDISRHCAIDKVVGRCLDNNINPSNCILVTTGRISSEFLWKAKLLNIPMIASLKYPSETGNIIAKSWGINLASKILSDDILLTITCKEKIVDLI